MIASSDSMRALVELATRASARDTKVLITGESGVGKDVLARFIHSKSPRAGKPFIAVNCAGLAETLLESELFGHVKGSFTGAYRDKLGKLELADGGTIFLDEVGEMTPRMQALLLRFLESGEVQPVGGESVHRRVDARVIAATNRDLEAMTAAGTFREDLLYRIRVVHLRVPALRERPDDIQPLLTHFLSTIDPAIRLTEDAWRMLESHSWPGNIRELQNVVEQLSAVGHQRELGPSDLPAYTRSQVVPRPRAADRRRDAIDALYERLLDGSSFFWCDVYDTFMDRDMTRAEVRHLISRGLAATEGSYRRLLTLFRLPAGDYKRLLNFLERHGCAVDFRPFRLKNAPAAALRSIDGRSLQNVSPGAALNRPAA
ncbi:MAG TPA: sigma 54-interacting transcriptional regulator [Vicinamibacterales bacterium]|jgi:transcriptional regulator with PAS, ATPase and Fis domain|nr:sigma 54-interacting transcriptional regulator [Vicinamibacterales bacterium]